MQNEKWIIQYTENGKEEEFAFFDIEKVKEYEKSLEKDGISYVTSYYIGNEWIRSKYK